MKKVISVLLVAVLLFSTASIVCFADETPYLIDRQSAAEVRDIPWGTKGNTASNGCGWISVYNIMAYNSPLVTTQSVISDLTAYHAPFFFGLLGANPFAMTRYLKTKFNDVSMTLFNSKKWAEKSNDKGGVIVLYQAKGMFSSLHYVAGLASGEKNEDGESTFYFYNTGKADSLEAISVSDYLSILKDYGYKLFVFFTVKDKNGEW